MVGCVPLIAIIVLFGLFLKQLWGDRQRNLCALEYEDCVYKLACVLCCATDCRYKWNAVT